MVSRANIKGLIAMISGILLFVSLTYIPAVLNLIKKYPWGGVALAVILFYFRHQIAERVGKE